MTRRAPEEHPPATARLTLRRLDAASAAIIRKPGLEFERMERGPGDDDDVAVDGLAVRQTEGG